LHALRRALAVVLKAPRISDSPSKRVKQVGDALQNKVEEGQNKVEEGQNKVEEGQVDWKMNAGRL
jgi:hypothetical protein